MLLAATVILSFTNCADACVDVYRIDKYGEKHLVRTEFCYKNDCPYYQKWKDATVEAVYEHDIAPAKPVNRSSTAEIRLPAKKK